MNTQLPSFKDAAIQLSRNPLGIIALFLLLIYGIACLTFSFSYNLHQTLLTLFVIFILIYPFVILAVFVYLVIKHHTKLYAPKDFVKPNHFIDCIYGHQKKPVTRLQDLAESSAAPVAKEEGEKK